MTTVAWDGKTLAADRRLSDGITNCKIWKLSKGRYISGAGAYDDMTEIVAWMRKGAKVKDRPTDINSTTMLLVCSNGKAYWLTIPYLRPVEIREPFYAIGSGAAYAVGAMAAGKSAGEAVAIASRFDPATGNGVDTVEVVK